MDEGHEEDFLYKKNALAMRLQQRRSRQVLAEQGIMPPLKSPGTYFPQVQRLERARKEDYLNHAIQIRPDREQLVQKHILEDTSASGSIVANQKDLKKAKLVDDLNDKIALRPGVIELVERNIFPATEDLQEAIKGGQLQYKKIADFIEEDSGDALSPEQFPLTSSPIPFQLSTTLSNSNADKTAILTTKNDLIRSSSGSSILQQSNSSHPYLFRQTSKGSNIRMSNARKKKDKPKFKKFKYHQYVPPDQHGKSNENSMPPLDEDTPYSRLLQQQQMYLQLQIMHKQYSNQMSSQRNGESSQTGTFNQQTLSGNTPPPPPLNQSMKLEKPRNNSPLTESKLDEMKVAELKEELKLRQLKVTGTKEVLVERLKPFCVRSDNLFCEENKFPQSGNSSIKSEVNSISMVSDGHSNVAPVTSVINISIANSQQNPITSNAQTAFAIDPNIVFSQKLARMPMPERHRIVLKQEKFTMPTWHSTEPHSSQGPPPGAQAAVNFNFGTSGNISKDKMLEKQQKEINDLKRMVELHRSQLQQLHCQKQPPTAKEQMVKKRAETARLSTTQFQFPVMSHTDHRQAEFMPGNSNTQPPPQQQQRHQENNPPNYEQAFEMMQEGESREQGHNNKDMDDLLELLTDSGELPVTPVVTRQLLNDHHSYHGLNNRRSNPVQNSYPQSGVNDYIITQEQVQLQRDARLNQMKGMSQDYIGNGGHDYPQQTGSQDLTKMLVESAGDALMDTSNFPPVINQYSAQSNPNMEMHSAEYSRPSARNSVDSGILYSTPHYSPMDTNVDSMNRDLMNDLRLSTSSLDSGEPTLNAVSLSPATPPRMKQHHTMNLTYRTQVSPRPLTHNLVKSSSQELLSNNDCGPGANISKNNELGWLDLTLGSAVGGPPSPGGPFDTMTLGEHHRDSRHQNTYHGSHDGDLNVYFGGSNGALNYPPSTNSCMLDPQWDLAEPTWEGILEPGFNT
ncbi:uncharacterized protein LOC143451551 isoform X2 [Clavelina lepadiformis]|uniref:uncharacterized protein LOC143451551 isoform X2 n=1 Tax=Clavelina lepadiformis TaxID=159417 RepID=UPI0040415D63